MSYASAGGFAMPCEPARPRANLVPFMRVLTAAAFVQPWPCQRDPVIFRSPPLPLPDALKALPAFLTDPGGATHMRVTVQLWDDGGHRVSHELGDGGMRWHADTPPTKFATVGEMLAAIVFQPEHRRRVWAGEDDRSAWPDLAAELAPPQRPTAAELGFIDHANTPVGAMRRSIHRSHRGEGNNFVD